MSGERASRVYARMQVCAVPSGRLRGVLPARVHAHEAPLLCLHLPHIHCATSILFIYCDGCPQCAMQMYEVVKVGDVDQLVATDVQDGHCNCLRVLSLAVQTFMMAIIASTLFIRPTMHRNNVGDASLYAAIPFYALVHMLFDGCVAPPCSFCEKQLGFLHNSKLSGGLRTERTENFPWAWDGSLWLP